MTYNTLGLGEPKCNPVSGWPVMTVTEIGNISVMSSNLHSSYPFLSTWLVKPTTKSKTGELSVTSELLESYLVLFLDISSFPTYLR